MNLAELAHLNGERRPAAQGASRRLCGCESLVVCYRSEARAIAELLPSPLRPDGANAVSLQFCATPAAGGRGVDIVAQIAIDAELHGTPVQFIADLTPLPASTVDERHAGADIASTLDLPQELAA